MSPTLQRLSFLATPVFLSLLSACSQAEVEAKASFETELETETVTALETDTNVITDTDAPLSPNVSCLDLKCDITFSGKFNGRTLTTEPLKLSFNTSTSEDSHNLRPMSEQTLKSQNTAASYGWLMGEGRGEMEIYLTELADPWEADFKTNKFMLEQRVGFERIGYAYKFVVLDYAGENLVTARDIQTRVGPQARVVDADALNIKVSSTVYNAETGEHENATTHYSWYKGDMSERLLTSAENAEIQAQKDEIAEGPLTATPQLARFEQAFTKGNGAEKEFYKELNYIEPDERFTPLLDICGIAPDSENPSYELFDASYTDHEGYQYDPAFSVRLGSQDTDGGIFVGGFSYPLETLDVKVSGLSTLVIKSSKEDVSGASWAYSPSGYAFESHGFEDMNVERQIYCADALAGATFIRNFADSKLPAETIYPIRYSITFPNNGINNEGMCEYMYDEVKEIIRKGLEYYNLQPILQIAEAPNNDMRLTLAEHNNTHHMAQNDCRFDMFVAATWTGDFLDPIPARNQNYESGYELIDQGISGVAQSFRDYKEAEAVK